MVSEDELLSVLSDFIRKKRIENNLSCEKLAELCDMDYSSLNLIENKKQNPRSYSLYKILLNLDFDILSQIHKENSSQVLKERLLKKIGTMNEHQVKSWLKMLSLFDINLK